MKTLLCCVVLASCTGDIPEQPPGLTDPAAFGITGVRRLTRLEITSSVGDAFGVPADDLAEMLPEDLAGTNPFDNDYEAQTVSGLVISNYSTFAEAYAAKLAATPGLAQQLGGCTTNDAACFRAVLSTAGRRMFRHPLTTDELDAYTAKIYTGDFPTAIEMMGLLLVQHPRFLYRTERPSGDLDDYEIATRIAFLLWGQNPDDKLLDAAAAGELVKSSDRATQAQRMLDDPRAQRQLHRFHALWLGYSVAPLPAALADDLRSETEHLIDRVVFEQDADWLTLFASDESYLTPALATQYGLPAVAQTGWTAGRGGGVLSHGTFLTLGAKFGDTSPTVRGNEIYKRITCSDLPPIPPSVDTDMPPGDPAQCKQERYTMRLLGGCQDCHGIIDNVGLGLENFGVSGAWRTTEPGKPQCSIAGNGIWNGDAFLGVSGLGKRIVDDPRTRACATKQLFRFVAGRDETTDDTATLGSLATAFTDDRSLRNLLAGLVASPAIAFRKGN